MTHTHTPTTWVESDKADQKHKVMLRCMLRGQSNFKAQLRLQETL